jgi:hypothetical protein
VSAACAIRWRQLALKNGTPAAKPQDGAHRSIRIEDHADLILAAIERQSDIALEELRAMLMTHGVSASVSVLWRFCARPAPGSARLHRHPERSPALITCPGLIQKWARDSADAAAGACDEDDPTFDASFSGMTGGAACGASLVETKSDAG